MNEFTYIDIIDRLLLKKTGKKACELEYMDPPDEDDRYNTTFGRANIHLIAGRIRTKRKSDELVNEFLHTVIP